MKFSMKLFFMIMFGSAFISGCTGGHDQQKDQVKNAVEKYNTSSSGKNKTLLAFKLNSLEEIRNTFQLVNKSWLTGALDSVSFNYNCNGERKGQVTYFRHKEQLVLIIHQYSEYDHFSAREAYYLHEDQPYFIFSANTTWAFQDGGGTKDKIIEKRTYITTDEKVKCLERVNTILTDSQGKKSETEGKDKTINCDSKETRLADFSMLLKYSDKGTTGCLEK